MKIFTKALAASSKGFATAAVASVALMSTPAIHAGELSGSIDVVSKYVLRGITTVPEDADGAIQAGLTYTTDPGVYLSWWASSLDYVNSADPSVASPGVENNFVVGYSTDVGGVSLDFGALYYYYISVEDADALEPYINVGVGPVTIGAKYLTKDTIWGNAGDIYFTIGGSVDLPSDFTLSALAGFFRYEKTGDFITSTESSGFRHLDVTLSKPLGKTGLTGKITYIFGGEDRNGNDQDNTLVLGLSAPF